jgi:hypothetical protein
MKYHGIADEITETTTTITHPNRNKTVSVDRSSCQKCLIISILATFLATTVFFILGHWILALYNKVQYTNPQDKTFCDKQLFHASFGLLIANYCVGIFVVILAFILYGKYFPSKTQDRSTCFCYNIPDKITLFTFAKEI